MSHTYDAVVIGSGVAGSSLAKALADKGWDTQLIDRRTFPRHKVCGEFLSPEAQGGLYRLGLLDKVKSLEIVPIRTVRIILASGESLDIRLHEAAWGISRYAMDSFIQEEARNAGAAIRTGALVNHIEQGADHLFTVETRMKGEKRTIRSRTVIGAWGQQPVKHGRATKATSYFGVKSHYTGLKLDQAVELYFFPGGYMGLAPVGEGVVNASALLRKEAFQQTDKSVLGMLNEAASRNMKLAAKLKGAVPLESTQAAISPVALSKKPVTWDQFALVGDAATAVPPLCGDGMSMALRSAFLCSGFADTYLRGECSLTEWQTGYGRSIRNEFNRPLRWGRKLQVLSELPALPRLLVYAARTIPGLAPFFLQATRLRDESS